MRVTAERVTATAAVDMVMAAILFRFSSVLRGTAKVIVLSPIQRDGRLGGKLASHSCSGRANLRLRLGMDQSG